MLRVTLLLAVAACLLPATALAADTDQTLSVVGHGTVQRRPDTAQITVSVRRTAPTARAARDSVNRRTARVIAAAVKIGIPRTALKTSSIRLSRSTIRPLRRGGPRRTRYSASAGIEMRVSRIGRLGTLFNAVTAAGATGIDGPEFSFADPSAGRADAERAALADARRRADAAAAQLGLVVVGVRGVNLDPGRAEAAFPGVASEVTTPATPQRAPRPAVPTPVQPGTEEVEAEVAVLFLVAPPA